MSLTDTPTIRQPENEFIRHRMEIARCKAMQDQRKASEVIEGLPRELVQMITKLPKDIAIAAMEAAVKGEPRYPHLTPVNHIMTVKALDIFK